MEGSGSVGGDNGDEGTLPCPLTPKTRKYSAAEQKAKQLERTQRAIESQRRMEQAGRAWGGGSGAEEESLEGC